MPAQKQVLILAIETSADETSAAVVQGNVKSGKSKLLSNIIYSQIKIHQKTGGIVPEVAARAHILKILPAIELALKKARTTLEAIDAIAVTAGPGLITSLMIGVDTAKTLTFALRKPIIPINHLEGHLLSALPTSYKLQANSYPILGLIVSGGHTLLVLVKSIGRYQILGETLDDAAGECFDKVAKLLGLPYPGGPELANLAKSGNPKAVDFPRPMLTSKNYHFSFAGLKTAVLYFLRDHNLLATNYKLQANIAASAEAAIIDVLVAKTLRAAKEYKVKTILLGGGVAANQKLRQTLAKIIKKNLPATSYKLPPPSLTTDNAGMIALAAFYHYIYNDITTFDKVKADPNLKLISWRS